MLAGIATILVPWTLVNMLNMKRNPGVYGPMLTRSGFFSAITLLAFNLNSYQRKLMLDKFNEKYFKDVTDKQMIEFDSIF